MNELRRCHYCHKWINPDFGEVEPAQHQDAQGDKEDPRSPGDHNECCDVCCYGEPRRCTS